MSESTGRLKDILETLEAATDLKKFRGFQFFQPYVLQAKFTELGATYKERLLMAANRVGKTMIGAYETACHLTGEYPDWWLGRRWDRPTRGWIAGVTSIATRDIQQKLLCGEPGVVEDFGSGMIPRGAFVKKRDGSYDISLARGVTDSYDTIQVRHASGGISIGRFKSYEQGKAKFQGETLDWAWCDEEPDPIELYIEILTRLVTTRGILYTTFTPLEGETELVKRFWPVAQAGCAMVQMDIRDALHIPKEDIDAIIASYPQHMRDAKAHGIPMLGSGVIFDLPQETIAEDRIADLPSEWKKLWGIDFGVGHPFAAVLAAYDSEDDVIHITHCYRSAGTFPLEHSAAMKAIAANVPVAWPHDGTVRRGEEETVASIYKAHGLLMLGEHSTFVDGGYSTEAAILELQERMRTGRFKVASHLSDWFDEYRSYHRKDGDIVKVKDDLLSATMKIVMMKRFARTGQYSSKSLKKSGNYAYKGSSLGDTGKLPWGA